MRLLLSFIFLFPTLVFSQKGKIIVEFAEIWGTSVLASVLMVEENNSSIYIEIGNPTKQPSAEQIFSNNFNVNDIGYLILKKNDIFYHNGLMPPVKNVLTEDKAPKINWKILKETKEIMGYQCIKAECEFRGRKVFAFFSPEIPFSSGPWKYSGLPGLILEAWQEDEQYHYVTKKLILNSQLEIPNAITAFIDKLKENPISFKEYVQKENNFSRKLESMTRASLSANSYRATDFLRESDRELQFEWEKEPEKRGSGNVMSLEEMKKKVGLK
ncbi:MAG: GLPGLI family protein [Bacteroidetes bacterium]|nr:GLPGLI family protein [Bacteroidota bacterium]